MAQNESVVYTDAVEIEIPEGIMPSGVEDIDANGDYDVFDKAGVKVRVPQGVFPSGAKQINITTNGITTEDVTDYADAEIAVNVPVGVPNGEIVRMTYYKVVVGENTITNAQELKAYLDAAVGRTDYPAFASVRKKESYLRYEFMGIRPVNVGLRDVGLDTFGYGGTNNTVISAGSIIDIYYLSWSMEE